MAPTVVEPLTLWALGHQSFTLRLNVSFTAPCAACVSESTEKRKLIHRLYHHRKHTKSYFFLPDSPRKTSIIKFDQARVGYRLRFQCNTDAYPLPHTYSWYRYNKNKQTDSSLWKNKTTEQNSLYLESVQRADEACYRCSATNSIDTGMKSEEMCIQVLCK